MQRFFAALLTAAFVFPLSAFGQSYDNITGRAPESILLSPIPNLGAYLNEVLVSSTPVLIIEEPSLIIDAPIDLEEEVPTRFVEEPDRVDTPLVMPIVPSFGNGAPEPVVVEEVMEEQTVASQGLTRHVYGDRFLNPAYSPLIVREWEEFTGVAPRTYYSTGQRSSRIFAMYGLSGRVRYYPPMHRASRELAGVYEYDAKLLTDNQG